MKLRKLTALVMALMLAVCFCALPAAAEEDDHEYEGGDPPRRPEFMLRSDPDAGWGWTCAFEKGGVGEINEWYQSMAFLREHDRHGTYEGEGGYLWMRIEGVTVGTDTATFLCDDERAPIKRMDVAFIVDEEWNVKVLSITTDGAAAPAVSGISPIHPVVRLKSNPTTGYNWAPDNSYTPGLRVESEYIPDEVPEGLVGAGGVENVTFFGTDFTIETLRYAYARSWEEGVAPIVTLSLTFLCWDSTEAEIADVKLTW